jgi:hypothetical protein
MEVQPRLSTFPWALTGPTSIFPWLSSEGFRLVDDSEAKSSVTVGVSPSSVSETTQAALTILVWLEAPPGGSCSRFLV